MFPYTGSKKLEIKKFKDYFPRDFDLFVEPFGGGGSVSLYFNKLDKPIHINDIREDLVKLYKYFLTDSIDKDYIKIQKIYDDIWEVVNNSFDKIEVLKEQGKILFSKRDDILYDLAFRKLKRFSEDSPKISSLVFNIPSANRKPYLTNFKTYQISKLTNPLTVKISNKSYRDLFQIYEKNENTFIFLDPPYQEDNTNKIRKSYHNNENHFSILDLETIRNFMKSCKCKVMLVIDGTDKINQLFEDMIKYSYSKTYQLSKKTSVHLVICNY